MIGYLVLIHQIIAHLALLAVIFFFPIKYFLMTLMVYCLLYCFGGTITYHRLLSHNSFKPQKWFYYLGSFIGTLSCSGSPIAWVATHIKHHRFTDQEKDPHSMRYFQWYKIQWLTMLVKPDAKYAVHLLRSRYQVFLHRYYFLIHLIYALILTAIDFKLVFYFYLAPAALVWEAGSIINTICHKYGYVNYKLTNDSKNNTWVTWLTFGEGLHNNHHARQSNFDFSRKSTEVDIGGLFIRLLQQRIIHKKIAAQIDV